MDVIINM